jgi:cephalosporin hydroxylase
MRLTEIAQQLQTGDEISKPVEYFERYEPYFMPLQAKPVSVLELGVYKGVSLKVFASFFKEGLVVGVDIHDQPIDFSGFCNIVFEHGDQRNTAQLAAISERHAPSGWDIVIDDASHYGGWSLLSFQALFPRLKNGGLYIVEDWATGYYDDWPDGSRFQRFPVDGPDSHIPRRLVSHDTGMVGFVKSLVDDVADRPISTRASHIAYPSLFEFMNITPGFVILKKR